MEVVEVSPPTLYELKGKVGELVGTFYVLETYKKGKYSKIVKRAWESYQSTRGKNYWFAFLPSTFNELPEIYKPRFPVKGVMLNDRLFDIVWEAECKTVKQLKYYKREAKERWEQSKGMEQQVSYYRMNYWKKVIKLKESGLAARLSSLTEAYKRFNDFLEDYKELKKERQVRKPDGVVFQQDGKVNVFEFKAGKSELDAKQKQFYEKMSKINGFTPRVIHVTGITQKYYIKESMVENF